MLGERSIWCVNYQILPRTWKWYYFEFVKPHACMYVCMYTYIHDTLNNGLIFTWPMNLCTYPPTHIFVWTIAKKRDCSSLTVANFKLISSLHLVFLYGRESRGSRGMQSRGARSSSSLPPLFKASITRTETSKSKRAPGSSHLVQTSTLANWTGFLWWSTPEQEDLTRHASPLVLGQQDFPILLRFLSRPWNND